MLNQTQFEKLPRYLKGDKMRFTQVVVNLVKNALKFDYKGNIQVVSAHDAASESMKVVVIDHGKGVCEQDMQKLFQEFGKLERTTVANDDGIGFGLAICKYLVEANNGQIEIHSDGLNTGCAVRFSM